MIAKNSALVADTSTQTGVFYPETDGMPLPDGNYQLEHFLDIQLLLKFFFKDYPDVRGQAAIRSYTTWRAIHGSGCRRTATWRSASAWTFDEEQHLSAVGNGQGAGLCSGDRFAEYVRDDLGNKRELYARLGIVEYWRFDPSGGEHYGEALVGERLVEGEYGELEMIRNVDGTMWPTVRR